MQIPCRGFVELLEKALPLAVLAETVELTLDPPRQSLEELISLEDAGVLHAEPQEEHDRVRVVAPGVAISTTSRSEKAIGSG